MKISASIYSFLNNNLMQLVQELDNYHIDYFHIDCKDDMKVFEDIKTIRQISKTPIDLHIISSSPEKYFEPILDNNVELVTFQYENLNGNLHLPDALTSRCGIAIVSETPVDVFQKYHKLCSFILFMTTIPGKSGGQFNKTTFKKIREFRKKFPGVRIHVDGGVTEEVSFILRNMGVYAAVTGSYLFNAHSIGAAMLNLKSDNVRSHYRVKDFMMELYEIPILKEATLRFQDVLESIEKGRMGVTFLVDAQGKLSGIISNADVRRGLLLHINDLNKIDVHTLINRNPVIAYEDMTISELLEHIKRQSFPILYLPVVNSYYQLTGALKFNNLIKGES